MKRHQWTDDDLMRLAAAIHEEIDTLDAAACPEDRDAAWVRVRDRMGIGVSMSACRCQASRAVRLFGPNTWRASEVYRLISRCGVERRRDGDEYVFSHPLMAGDWRLPVLPPNAVVTIAAVQAVIVLLALCMEEQQATEGDDDAPV